MVDFEGKLIDKYTYSWTIFDILAYSALGFQKGFHRHDR